MLFASTSWYTVAVFDTQRGALAWPVEIRNLPPGARNGRTYTLLPSDSSELAAIQLPSGDTAPS